MALEAEEKTLYVANLDRNVNEELLYELFLQAGPIERVNIPCNSNDSHRYGFVTYKHDSSIDYAIELFKGTRLFKKDLVVKKKGERVNNQQNMNFPNNFGQFNFNMMNPAFLMNMNMNMNMNQLDYSQLLAGAQQFLMPNEQNVQNFNSPNQRNDNFSQNSLKGHWTNRSRPYDRDRNYSSRPRERRDRRDRDSGKSYRDRKGRY